MVAGDVAWAWALNEREVPRLGSETFEEFTRLFELSASAWVYTSAGAPVAFLLGMTPEVPYDSPNFLWFRERHERFVYVDRLAVEADHRKRGLGAALYAATEDDARRLGMSVVCCEVNLRPANPESLAFHARLGFRQEGEQEAHGKRVAMLVKTLAPASRPLSGG